MYALNLENKKGLVFGVANRRSIAWAIAEKLNQAGSRMAFGYQGERLRSSVEKLTACCREPLLLDCDVTEEEQLDALFATLEESFGNLDFVVHGVAFAPRETFDQPFYQVTRSQWTTAMDVSAYSLVAIARRAQRLMLKGGSITTLTYLASQRVVPKYNMMGVAKAALEASVRFLAYDLGGRGIRVNAISAGPLRTVAAKSIPGFGRMFSKAAGASMLRRNI
ncbi:MAG: enoyl-ACP reductase, partial [Acidobacteriota bacterium]